MTKEVGTLAEIGAKPGDTVKLVENGIVAGNDVGKIGVVMEGADGDLYTRGDGMNRGDNCSHKFQIVSRASDKPKLWRDMTPEEKGALLLAYHEGKVIEWTGYFGSEFNLDSIRGTPVWSDTHAYRIKPEPKVETVTLMTAKVYAWISEPYGRCGTQNTHRITFNLIDGEPDCTSIKMEKL